MEKMFYVGSAPRLYKEDPRPAESELRESLETAVTESRWQRVQLILESQLVKRRLSV
jgi:hypothetical protein